jgi:hypothetical protein
LWLDSVSDFDARRVALLQTWRRSNPTRPAVGFRLDYQNQIPIELLDLPGGVYRESPSSSQLRIGFRRRCRVGLFDAGGPSNSLGVDDHPYLACQLKCTCNHFDIYGFHCSTDAYHTCGLINITLHFVYRNCQKHLCL